MRWFPPLSELFGHRTGSEGSSAAFGVKRDPTRLLALSDGVFAIAVTLLVLDIRPPQDTEHLFHGLGRLWPSYLAYVITFLLIGNVWANHHLMFNYLRAADRLVLLFNTLLLMDIAFLPFAASVLSAAFQSGDGQRSAIIFYGAALEVAPIMFNIIWWYASHERRLTVARLDPAARRAIGRRFALAMPWIAIGTALGGLLPLLGVVVIAAFILGYWLPISGEIASVNQQRDNEV